MKSILLILLLIPILGHGSNNLDETKFELISATIQFLATDEKISNSEDVEFGCKMLDYNCLIGYCQKKQIIGAQEKIEKWKEMSATNLKELQELSDEIIFEITNEKEKKDYRTKFVSYNDFILKHQDILNSYIEVPTSKVLVDNKSVPESETNKDKHDKFTINDRYNLLVILALGFALVSTFLSVFLIGKRKITDKLIIKVDSMEVRLNNYIAELPILKANLKEVSNIDNYNVLLEKIATLDSKFLDKEKREIEFEIHKQSNIIKVEKVNQQSQHKYAKIPDLHNGFSNNLLILNQDGEQIFELTINDNVAEFRVSNDLGAQKYALSDFNYYLSSVCTFSNQPLKGSRIQTLKPGILRKDADKWIVEQKAQIEFI